MSCSDSASRHRLRPGPNWAVILALAGATACAGAKGPAQRVEVRTAGVVMQGREATPSAAAPRLAAQVFDAPALFHAALEAAHADDAPKAIFFYSTLIDTFPAHPLVVAAHYNRGLQYELLNRWQDAVADDRAILRDAPHDGADRTWLDAHFRLGVCLTHMHAGWAAVSVFDAALREELDDDERLEAMLGRGIAMQDIGADDAAEAALEDALHFFESGQRRDIQSDRDLAAEAAYRLGMINTSRFERVVLAFPAEALQRALEKKCEYLLTAQTHYMHAIHLGDAHTLAAAGWGIGSLYENLYDAITLLEAPTAMSAEEADVYHDEVRQRVAVLVKKAIMVYERALMAGRATSTADAWVARLEKALDRLRKIYLRGVSEGLTPRGETGH